MNSDSSEEEQTSVFIANVFFESCLTCFLFPDPPLASSIHTIYRPIARSRKHEVPVTAGTVTGKGKGSGRFSPVPSSDEEDGTASDEDDDFEATPVEPRMTGSPTEMSLQNEQISTSPTSRSQKMDRLSQLRRSQMTRSSSLATVRVKRRTMLAEKLKDVFGLNEIKEVVAGTRFAFFHRESDLMTWFAELPCWLLRSVRK